MNIALVTHAFSWFGGTEKYVFDLSRWLDGRGHEVHIYCARVDVPRAKWGRIQVHQVAHLGRRGLVGLSAFAWSSRAAARGGHDIVQGFGRTIKHDVFRAGGGVHEAWLARRYQRAWQRLALRLSPKVWLERWIDHAAFNYAKIVICNSEMVAEEVRERHQLRDEQVRVIRNGVDCQRFRPDRVEREARREELGVSPEGRLVMFVGNGYRRKGVLTAAKAFAKVAGPLDRFVVLGSDSHYRKYCRQVRRMVGDSLIYVGPVEDTSRWLPAADALLLPTLYDPAANVTLEAMACGVPPVVSASDGNHEVVPSKKLVVESAEDEHGFASGLSWVFAEGDSLRHEVRARAESWPVSRNGEAMESLYQEFVHA
jgi:UDP-glucose:(heptosyl)LPS alpha-1,3-glucosyltransferase